MKKFTLLQSYLIEINENYTINVFFLKLHNSDINVFNYYQFFKILKKSNTIQEYEMLTMILKKKIQHISMINKKNIKIKNKSISQKMKYQ